MKFKRLIIALGVIILVSACGFFDENSGADQPTPTATATINTAVSANPTPAFTSAITTTTPANNTLTLWLPPEIAQQSEAGTAVLNNQLSVYSANKPDLELRIEEKPVSGPGGILSYLRTGRNVAPAILPDLIALPAGLLASAAGNDLIYPLDDLIHPSLQEDLFPAAQEMSQSGGQILGFPFALNGLTHLAYKNLPDEPEFTNWSELIASENSFVFPAPGESGAALALQFYLAAGGQLQNEAGQINLETAPLVTALEQLSRGRNNGFISLQSSNLKNSEEAWQAFQGSSINWVLTTSETYLTNRSEEFSPGFTAVPGPDNALIPLVDGWAWAISTTDPVRRAQAAELLTTLVSADNLGQWSQASDLLPATQLGMAQWPVEDDYINFLRQELARAQWNPMSQSSSLLAALEGAVFDVITLTESPQNAAQNAVQTILPD